MIPEFEPLNKEEIDVVIKAPTYVAILIAGADGEIDNTERRKSIEMARIKQNHSRVQLVDYYKVVGDVFEENFISLLNSLSEDTEKRTQELTLELEKLNSIFPKINKNFSAALDASLKDIAKKIAEASGGILGYLSIGFEEYRLMDLKMIEEPK